jgi:hypothetical protein
MATNNIGGIFSDVYIPGPGDLLRSILIKDKEDMQREQALDAEKAKREAERAKIEKAALDAAAVKAAREKMFSQKIQTDYPAPPLGTVTPTPVGGIAPRREEPPSNAVYPDPNDDNIYRKAGVPIMGDRFKDTQSQINAGIQPGGILSGTGKIIAGALGAFPESVGRGASYQAINLPGRVAGLQPSETIRKYGSANASIDLMKEGSRDIGRGLMNTGLYESPKQAPAASVKPQAPVAAGAPPPKTAPATFVNDPKRYATPNDYLSAIPEGPEGDKIYKNAIDKLNFQKDRGFIPDGYNAGYIEMLGGKNKGKITRVDGRPSGGINEKNMTDEQLEKMYNLERLKKEAVGEPLNTPEAIAAFVIKNAKEVKVNDILSGKETTHTDYMTPFKIALAARPEMRNNPQLLQQTLARMQAIIENKPSPAVVAKNLAVRIKLNNGKLSDEDAVKLVNFGVTRDEVEQNPEYAKLRKAIFANKLFQED